MWKFESSPGHQILRRIAILQFFFTFYFILLNDNSYNSDDKEEVGFLDKQYKKMTFISEESVLSKYLSSSSKSYYPICNLFHCGMKKFPRHREIKN